MMKPFEFLRVCLHAKGSLGTGHGFKLIVLSHGFFLVMLCDLFEIPLSLLTLFHGHVIGLMRAVLLCYDSWNIISDISVGFNVVMELTLSLESRGTNICTPVTHTSMSFILGI